MQDSCYFIQRLSPHQLADIQIRLEYVSLSRSLFQWVPASPQRAQFIVYKFPAGFHKYYHEGLDSALVKLLAAMPVDVLLNETAYVSHLLAKQRASSSEVYRGSSYVFTSSCDFSTLDHPVSPHEHGYAVCMNGKVVSFAKSARENSEAAEIIVGTDTEYRLRGFAKLTASKWGRHILDSGRVPFYSHRAENFVSGLLAKSLKVRKFCEIAAYD